MNDILARRAAQRMTFQQLHRTLPVMWDATRVTKEPLNIQFVKEELMRTNGHRTMPLLLGASAAMDCHQAHLASLQDNYAWAESFRAQTERHQTPFSARVGAMGRMGVTIPSVRTNSTAQSMFGEQIARVEGILQHEAEPTDE